MKDIRLILLMAALCLVVSISQAQNYNVPVTGNIDETPISSNQEGGLNRRIISFAGRDWYVKSGAWGPGPNHWSDSTSSVWVDANGNLHLKIRREGSTWYCAEVYTTTPTQYGMHRFYLASRVDLLDKNVVAAPFIYANDEQEVDIEFAKWGYEDNQIGNYTVQPSDSDSHVTFDVSLNGDYSTHYFDWQADGILFKSFHGHYQEPPNSAYLINEWLYTGDKNPLPSTDMHIHINLWLSQGRPPSDGQEVELIVSDIDYPSLSINPASQLVPCTSGEFPITVTSITSWTVSDDASWLSCSPDSGSNNGEVTVSYEANTTTSSRTAIVTFACNGIPDKTCTVTQASAPTPEIYVSPSSLDFGNQIIDTGATLSYNLSANYLSSNVLVTAPAGFAVSTSQDGTYSPTLTVIPSGGNVSQTIWVKFTPTQAVTYAGNVSNASSGATTANVAVSGTGMELAEIQLEIEYVDNGLCRLNWNEIPGATSYLVYSADEPLPYDSPAWIQIAQTANQYLVIQASDARKFFYVKAVVDSVSADFISVPVMQ